MRLPKRDLLRDLAGLLAKYPSQDWLRLARIIEQERSRSRILAVLKGLSISARAGGTGPLTKLKPRAKKHTSHGIEAADEFQLELKRMPARELKKIAVRIGLPVSPKDSRTRLAERISRGSKLRIKRERPTMNIPKESDDYSTWAKVILGQMHKTTPKR